MAQEKIRFSLKYTLTGLAAGFIISVIIMLIILISANVDFRIEDVSSFFAENRIVFFMLFIPAFLTIIIGYITDLNLNNLFRSKFAEFEEEKQHSRLIFNVIEKLRKGESIKNLKNLPEDDKIIYSLINLSEEIDKRQEEQEKRKQEDAQRAETSEGLAYFGAVLREYNENIEVLTKTVTNELVKYTEAYQAAFYLIDDSNPNGKVIKEVANFASGKKRFADKELKWGEGLIGACIAEKKSNYLKNISDDYIEIESGLGRAKPKSLLIVPVVTQEGVIHGAIEIASFKEYKEYEIKFIEQVAENTAMTISTLKINEETAALLKESREQAKVLTSREDELQKTISEMRRLQENADIQSAAFRSYQDATNNALIRAEFSNEGKLLFANRKFLKLFEYKSNSEIENEDISKFVSPDSDEWFDNLKETVLIKNSHIEGLIRHLTKSGKTVWIESSYIGLKNEKGKNEKILFLGIDATQLKTDIQNFELKLKKIDNALQSLDFQINGDVLNVGEQMLKKLSFTDKENIPKTINNLVPETGLQAMNNIIEKLIDSDETYEGEIDFLDAKGLPVRFYGTIFTEKDINENITSIKFLGYDYSQQVNFAEKIKEQEEIIQNQLKEIETVKERMTKRTEQIRKEMRELYLNTETAYILGQKTFDSLPEAIITLNKDNEIEFINKKASEILNVQDKNKIKGADIKTLLPDIEKKYDGIYLGDILDIENEELQNLKEQEVYIVDNDGKPVKYRMLPVKVSVGLRQQLSVFLRK